MIPDGVQLYGAAVKHGYPQGHSSSGGDEVMEAVIQVDQVSLVAGV